MKIVTIIGARPQFIKAAVCSRVIKNYNDISEVIIHTGQHFDDNMSKIFFDELSIPIPHYNLNINSLNHGSMTGKMLEEIEKILMIEKPDWVIVYGDTNSTLAGALAAKKMNIKVAHIEAGLRSNNLKMPEEINRILTDRISDLLFCPTQNAILNLENEGYKKFQCKFLESGDVMNDAAKYYSSKAKKPITFNIPEDYILCTIHRAENTDDILRLKSIFHSLIEIAKSIKIILPLHPRTKAKLLQLNINFVNANIVIVPPLGYLEMIYLLKNCKLVMTDSGGLQKEAFFFKKYCITLRDETEWIELVQNEYNFLVGSNSDLIIESFNKIIKYGLLKIKNDFYGDGKAGELIINKIYNYNEK